MKRFKRFQTHLTTDKTTPYNRIVGLTLGVMNIPGLIFGFIMMIPVMFIPLPLFLPGAVLFFKYWNIYKDKVTEKEAIVTWYWTMILNAVYLIPTAFVFAEDKIPFFFMMMIFQVMTIFVAATAYRDLKEKQDREEKMDAVNDFTEGKAEVTQRTKAVA